MKPIIKFTISFLIAGLLFVSCKKESVQPTVIDQPTLPPANIGDMMQTGRLSVPRYYVAAATAGNKIVFAGGHEGGIKLSSRVDIYDTSTQTWSIAELSEARTGIGAVTVGNKILFAGGAKNFNYDDGWYNLSTRIDIYDVSANSWSTAELPEPMNFLWWEGAATAAGNKVFFCGGDKRGQVYIYDVVTNTWSTGGLSIWRSDIVAASSGNKILIAGGGFNSAGAPSKTVDIYDTASNTLLTASLSEARRLLRAATLNNKVFFAGGMVYGQGNSEQSDRIDIYDNLTQSWSATLLSKARVLQSAVSSGQRIFFFGGRRVDIYDATTDKWSADNISEEFDDGSAIIAAGGNIYATTGELVWKVQL